MMITRSRTAAVLASACALALATPAAADTVVSKLRVEAGGNALDPGTSYSNGTIRAETTNACGKSTQGSYKLRGANASGLVGHAARVNGELEPFKISDKFDFALIVCRIGAFAAFGQNHAWLYKVNHEEAQVAGEDLRLSRGDEVLWYFADFSSGANTGKELDLKAPDRARPGDAVVVTAYEYSLAGERQPAAGAIVSGGASPAGPTDANGQTTVVVGGQGTTRLRATRGSADIASDPVPVCVNADIDKCPPRRGERILGTNGDDPIRGTRGADTIFARKGDDRVKVEGGGRDAVDCGPGRDRVEADGKDDVDGNCEVVTG